MVSGWVGVGGLVDMLDEIKAITALLGWSWLAWAELGNVWKFMTRSID